MIALALALALAAPEPPARPEGAPPAPPLPFQARVEKIEVKLGEPFAYQVEVRHPAPLVVSLPDDLPQGPFHLEPVGCRREESGGEVTTICAMRAALFALGSNDLPAVALRISGPDGTSTLPVPGPRVEGLGVIDPDAPAGKLQLRDLSPPAPLLVRSWRLVGWILGGLAAAALALVALRARRRRRGVEPPPPLPPHERFARRLASLEADRLGERGHAREHFYRLSEAVREYLGALLGVPALDLTTEELLDRVREGGDPRLEVEGLRPFLDGVDLVKFARAEAGPADCASGIAFGRALLLRTTPPAPPEVAPAAPGPGRGAA